MVLPDSPACQRNNRKRTNVFYLILIISLTLLVFSRIISFDFVNWDDNLQVTENRDIVEFKLEAMFSSYYVGMYQPVTSLLFSIVYNLFGSNASYFHATSLIFHLLNILLVYKLLKLIGVKSEYVLLSVFAFSIHPLQVEPVSWISSFSTLLFSFFLLQSLISFILFRENGKYRNAILMILFFTLSILSKVQAVIAIPMVILINRQITDRWYDRKMLYLLLPVTLISVTLFFVAISGRGATDAAEVTIFNQLMFALYKISFGFSRVIVPLELSSLYPIPDGFDLLILYGVLIVVLTVLLIIRNRKSGSTLTSFLMCISVLISVLPTFSSYITADRYYYLFVPFAIILFLELFKSIGLTPGKYFIIMIGLFWGILSFHQTGIWKNGEKLWSNVVSDQPFLPRGYDGLGLYYLSNRKYDKAIEQFIKSVEADSTYVDGWYNIGNYYDGSGKMELANKYYTIALSYDSCHLASLFNRGSNYIRVNTFDLGIRDLSAVILENPDYENAYTNRGIAFFQMNNYEPALEDFNSSLKLKPDKVISLYYRSLINLNLGNISDALIDVNTALKYDPENNRLIDLRSQIYQQ